jgi:hypothetical protein
MNIDQIVKLQNGVELSFGNAISLLVGAVRSNGVQVSWSVINCPLSDSALRKRAKRLESVAFPYKKTKTGFSFAFTSEFKEYELGFNLVGSQLAIDKPQEVKVQAVGKPVVQASNRVPTKYLATPNSIVIVADNGQPVIVNQDHLNFQKIKTQLEQDSTYDPTLLEPVKALQSFEHLGLSYDGKQILFEGKKFQNQMFDRLVDAIRDATPEQELKCLFAFVRRALNHPDKVTSERIFDFARHNSIELTEEGLMIGYKKVRSDFKDIHSNTFDNSPGKVLEMPRQMVEADHNKTCAAGLHFCSKPYLPKFGSNGNSDKVVRVLVDPADIVGIPFDYADSKCRTSKYIVLDEVTGKV